jgi:glycosyltransferase involved in cell wall biosynthesis
MDRSRIAVVIPALNENETIGSIVERAREFALPVVVDDGSSDDTGERARAAGAEVVTNSVNQGYDRALDAGFRRAAQMGCEYIITMDADGQHDPHVLSAFIAALADADVVLGVRDRRPRFAESLFGFVAFIRWRLQDPLCGLKAYRTDLFLELGHFDSYGSIGTELALYAARHGKRVAQIPIRTRERAGSPRFGRVLSANLRILRALWLGMIARGARRSVNF